MKKHSDIPMKDEKTFHLSCSWRKPDPMGTGRRHVDRFEFPLSQAERRMGERRIKDGSPQDRKNTADCIRRGRQIEKDGPLSWWKQLWRTIMPMLLFMMICGCAQAQEFSDIKIVDAIYLAEGGKHAQFPYGIRSVKCSISAECRKICWNTVKYNRQRFAKNGKKNTVDFITFLGNRYAPNKVRNDPKGLNSNWINNVKYFLSKN